jgi:hypothetical protein
MVNAALPRGVRVADAAAKPAERRLRRPFCVGINEI